MDVSRRKVMAMSAALFVMSPGAHASGAPVLLTVTGKVDGGQVSFDREELRSLDWQEITTFTSFTEGQQTFAGPTLASVLRAVAARGERIHATAINDYTVSFPFADAEEHDVLLAMEHNGRPMRVRDKGPIWVVYPLSEDEAAAQKRDAEMIWQLDRLIVD